MKRWWIILFSLLCILALLSSSVVITMSKQTLTMFFEVLIPSLFFLTVILKTMELSGLLDGIAHILQPAAKILLKSTENELPYVLSGSLLGFAVNSMLLRQAYENGSLKDEQVRHLGYHIHLPTISFCVLTCGTLLGDIRYGLILYGVQLMYCLIAYRFSTYSSADDRRTTQKNRPLRSSLTQAIAVTGFGLYQMAGYILLASIVMGFAFQFLPEPLFLPMRCIMEFASSAIAVCQLSIPLLHRLIILSLIFGFGGFTGHLQVYTFLDDFPLSYPSYLGLRVLQSVCTALITCFVGIWL